MANEGIRSPGPDALIGGASAAPYGGMIAPSSNVPIGLGAGIGFTPGVVGSVYMPVRIPNVAALATGVTIELLLAEDPSVGNVDAVNKNAVFGVTVGPITSATSTFDANATTGPLVSCTETTGTVTMPATAGVLKTQSLAIVIASMNSLAAGGWAMLRIRRLGTNASDTSRGRIVLLGADVRNT